MHKISTEHYSHCEFVEVANRIRHYALQAAFSVFLVLGLSLPGSVSAHDDPEVEELSEMIGKHPDRIDLVLRRSQMYRKHEDLNEALADVDRAESMEPGNHETAMERASVYSALGRYSEAEEILDHLVENENLKLVALAERAAVRAKLGDDQRAIEDWTTVIAEQPALEQYLNRGELLVNNGRLAEAAAGYREGLATLGSTGYLLNIQLIEVEIARKHYNEALKLVQDQLDRSQVKTQWMLLQAKIYGLMERPEDAQSVLMEAINEANRVLTRRATATNKLNLVKVWIAMDMADKANCELQTIVKEAPHLVEAKELLQQVSSGVNQTCTE